MCTLCYGWLFLVPKKGNLWRTRGHPVEQVTLLIESELRWSVICHVELPCDCAYMQTCVPARWLHIAAESYSLLLLPGSVCLNGHGTCHTDSRCIVNDTTPESPWHRQPWPPRPPYDDKLSGQSRLKCGCLLAINVSLIVILHIIMHCLTVAALCSSGMHAVCTNNWSWVNCGNVFLSNSWSKVVFGQ